MSQADLARAVPIDKGYVSRWLRGMVPLRGRNAERVVAVLQSRGVIVELAPAKVCRVFLATPMASLDPDAYQEARAQALAVYDVLNQIAAPVYWAGQIDSADQFEAPDQATERNLAAIADASAFVYYQPGDLAHPTSCHIELGFALAHHIPVTAFAPSEQALPYMLHRFEAVAERAGARYRFYPAVDACRLLAIHGPGLLGLDATVAA